jgi:endogenous inhibitor of DNA gyrase (YacG/DUF329 family)
MGKTIMVKCNECGKIATLNDAIDNSWWAAYESKSQHSITIYKITNEIWFEYKTFCSQTCLVAALGKFVRGT